LRGDGGGGESIGLPGELISGLSDGGGSDQGECDTAGHKDREYGDGGGDEGDTSGQ